MHEMQPCSPPTLPACSQIYGLFPRVVPAIPALYQSGHTSGHTLSCKPPSNRDCCCCCCMQKCLRLQSQGNHHQRTECLAFYPILLSILHDEKRSNLGQDCHHDQLSHQYQIYMCSYQTIGRHSPSFCGDQARSAR